MPEIKYCRECGSKLVSTKVAASEFSTFVPCGYDVHKVRLDSRFDEETGKMNLAEELVCYKWRKWFNYHDRIIKYKGEYHYQ